MWLTRWKIKIFVDVINFDEYVIYLHERGNITNIVCGWKSYNFNFYILMNQTSKWQNITFCAEDK